MGNKQCCAYQNDVKLTSSVVNEKLSCISHLFYDEYLQKDKLVNAPESNQIKNVLNQLTDQKFLDALKNESQNPIDFRLFLKVNNVQVEKKALVYSTMTIIHEVMSYLILNQTTLEQQSFTKDQKKTLVKQETSVLKDLKKNEDKITKKQLAEQKKREAEQKKKEAEMKKNNKNNQTQNKENIQQPTQQKGNFLFNHQVDVTSEQYTKDIESINVVKDFIINNFLPVFSNLNFNVINKPKYHQKYLAQLDKIYREVIIYFAKLFNGIKMYHMKTTFQIKEQFWNFYKEDKNANIQALVNQVQIKDDDKFSQYFIRKLQRIVEDIINEANAMNMRVRYKIKAQNAEDLDNSMEVTIDHKQVQQTQRQVYNIDVTFKKKKSNVQTPIGTNNRDKDTILGSTNDFAKNLLQDTDIMQSVAVHTLKHANVTGGYITQIGGQYHNGNRVVQGLDDNGITGANLSGGNVTIQNGLFQNQLNINKNNPAQNNGATSPQKK